MVNMDCHEAIKILNEFIEGEISESDRIRMQAHISSCSKCLNRIEFEKLIIESYRDFLNCEIPMDLKSKISCALDKEA